MNRANITFPCSCKKSDEDDAPMMPQKGFCEAPFGNGTQSGNNPEDWPVYQEVRGWLSGGGGWARQWVQTLWPPASPGLLLHRPFFTELFLPSFDSSVCSSFAPSSLCSSVDPFEDRPDPALLDLRAGAAPPPVILRVRVTRPIVG